jgi:hypothetical protein
METQQTTSAHRRSLAETLEATLITNNEKGPSIGEMTDAVGDRGFGLLLMILSLPSALPIPAPGYSIPFGIAMSVIAVQIIIGRDAIWLPERIKRFRLNVSFTRKIVSTGAGFLRRTEKLIRPRYRWMHTPLGHSALAIVIFAMAVFMMIPVPLTNTAPAMAIFIIGVSMAEEDGLIAICAFIAALVAAAASGTVLYLFIAHGPEAVDAIKVWIKARLGMEA